MTQRNSYTAQQVDFLRTGFAKMGIPDLTRAFNRKFKQQRSAVAIKGVITRHKITCGRSTGDLNKGKSYIFSQTQVKFIKNNYAFLSYKNLTEKLNRRFHAKFTDEQIRSFTRNHKIKSGRTGCFEKGHKTWNAGTKGQGFTGANITSFKKGNIPPNKKPLGSERIDNKDGYIHIKISERDPHNGYPTRFKQKHVVIWESVNGPVPEGMIVAFIDGDKTKCEIENLMLISRAELLRLNQYKYKEMPEELKPNILAMAKLETKIFSLSRT